MNPRIPSHAGAAYVRDGILTLGPVALVVRVLSGAITAIERARRHTEEGRPVDSRREINKARALVSELRAALDHDRGGEIATQLETIYEFITSCLLRPATQANVRDLKHAEGLIRRIKEGFDAVLTHEPTA